MPRKLQLTPKSREACVNNVSCTKMYHIIAFTGLAAAVVYLAHKVIDHVKITRLSRSLGCQPPPWSYEKLFGLVRLQQMAEADKNGRLIEEYAKVLEEVGRNTFQSRWLGDVYINTVEPQNIQAILASQFQDFELGSSRRGNFAPLLGHGGIFVADGKQWEHSRAMLRPQFARSQVADLGLEEKHVQHFLQGVPINQSGWTEPVDLAPMFFRLTLDSATEFLFGESVNSQLAANSRRGYDFEWNNLAPAFDAATKVLSERVRLGDLYWLSSPRSFRENCNEVHRFADHLIQKALHDLKSPIGPQIDDTRKPYVFLKELVKITQDPAELRSQLLNILLAGRDTTAGLLGWAFYFLTRNPAIFNRLRSEVLSRFGTFEIPHNLTFADLKSCSYLQHIMHETLRLYPSVPLNFRRASRDTTLPVGGGPNGTSPIFVRKNQEVGYYVYLMHRREDLWGSDAHLFNPDRWTGRKAGWEYLPFNGGPRICLGQQFALTEAGYIIVRLVQRFDRLEWRGHEGEGPPRHNYTLTDAPSQCLVDLHAA